MAPKPPGDRSTSRDPGARMRRFWDDRARENAVFYVDTSLDPDDPDMERFFAAGREVVRQAFVDAPIQPQGRTLAVEIGPGLGRICRALRAHFDRVIGVDISEEMVRQARELVPDDGIEFLVGDGHGLGVLDDGVADLVTTFTVFQHLPDPALVAGYIADSARVLRPGGVLAAQWNNLPHPLGWRLKTTGWRALRALGLRHRDGPRAEREFVGSRVPVRRIQEAVDAAGLRLVETRGEGTLFAWLWAIKEA